MSLTKKQQDWFYYICIAFCGLLSLFLHLYKLGTFPSSINVDEAGLWYNVQCLLSYGTDQANNSWPLLFKNMWSEQSAGYTYLAYLCASFLGNTLFAIRLPAVINTFLFFVFGLKIIDLLFENKGINIAFVILATITPYFTIISKMALDCNLMLGFSTIFLYYFFKALKTNKLIDFILAGIFCGITFYTYALSYLIIPLFLTFSLIYLICFKQISLKQVFAFFVPAFILGLPLLIVQVINIFDLNELVLFGVTFIKDENYRSGEFSFSLSNLGLNLFLSIIYIFKGLDRDIYNIPIGYMFYISSVFILTGWLFSIKNFIKSIKEKQFRTTNFLLFWAVSIVFILSLLNDGRSLYQQCAIYFVYVVFIIQSILEFLKILKIDKIKKVFIAILIIIYLLSFVGFLNFYFTDYNEHVNEVNLMAAEVPEELDQVEGRVYFLKHYIYYLASREINPDEFQADDNNVFMYKNIVFNFYIEDEKATVHPEYTYVVYYKDTIRTDILDKYEFRKERIDDYVFYRPIR